VLSGVWIASVALQTPASSMAALHRFYVERLGVGAGSGPGDDLSLTAGAATIRFVAAAGSARPFYHFALLVPGNRYDAAREWVERQTELLTRPGETMTTFRFDSWKANACYVHDPAGNIVELIAHHGVCDHASTGGFSGGEIAGISEVGIVATDPAAAVQTLAGAGLRMWSGDVQGPEALAFVGRHAHTLIVCPRARLWMPTMQPAELHPLTAVLRDGDARPVTVTVTDGTVSAG
jgi:catechol 2,3-dioxygenase-like lactoylglutathione lyase family enzyme